MRQTVVKIHLAHLYVNADVGSTPRNNLTRDDDDDRRIRFHYLNSSRRPDRLTL